MSIDDELKRLEEEKRRLETEQHALEEKEKQKQTVSPTPTSTAKLPPTKKRSGCMKWVMIGFAVIIVLAVIGGCLLLALGSL